MTNVSFQVIYDADYECYTVREASNTYAQSRTPRDHQSDFPSKAQAIEQVRRLGVHQRKGNEIALVLRYTPGAFEAVADKKYGVEW